MVADALTKFDTSTILENLVKGMNADLPDVPTLTNNLFPTDDSWWAANAHPPHPSTMSADVETMAC